MTDSTQDWPAGMDAMAVATDYHTVLLENDKVRVLDTRIASGQTVPPHTHRWPAVMFVQSFSDFIRYDGQGNVLFDSRTVADRPKIGEALWSPPLPLHSVTVVGDGELRVISIEIKGGVDLNDRI